MLLPNALLVGRAVRISSKDLRVLPALGYLRDHEVHAEDNVDEKLNLYFTYESCDPLM